MAYLHLDIKMRQTILKNGQEYQIERITSLKKTSNN